MKKIINSLNDGFFRMVLGHCLIYNTCWEDPAIDRKLPALDPESRIVMITSAGCNTLDYLLDNGDWMAGNAPEALEEEWELILQNSLPGTKILFRSAGLDHGFLPRAAKQALRFFAWRTNSLHVTDRVGTYGSLHFAEVA